MDVTPIPETYTDVAVLDLEGTLTPPQNTWVDLHDAAGIPREDIYADWQAYQDAVAAGENQQEAYESYMNGNAARWREAGLDEETIEQTLGAVPVREAGRELVEILDETGYYTVLVSGALDTYSQAAADELDIDTHIDTVSAEYDTDGAFTGFTWTDYKNNKAQLVADIRDKNTHVNTVHAVGNGSNDVGMVTAADHGYMVPNDDSVEYQGLAAEGVTVTELDGLPEVVVR